MEPNYYSNLKCAKCKFCLSVPPITTHSNSFFCGRPSCSNSDGERVLLYEKIAEKIQFPCKYQANGCEAALIFKKIGSHEKLCDKRRINCPHYNCLFEVTVDSIEKHFEISHEEDVLYDNRISGSKINNMGKLVLQHEMVFWLEIVKVENVLQIRLSKFVETYNKCFNSWKVILSGEKTNFAFELNDIPLYAADNNNEFFIVDENILKILSHDYTVEFVIAPGLSLKTEENLLIKLTCTVCCNLLIPPINQCKKGHVICVTCSRHFLKCKICSEEISSSCNIALEAVTKVINYPCLYFGKGCTFQGPLKEFLEHTKECEVYLCPINTDENCQVCGKLEDIYQHCFENHHYCKNSIKNSHCRIHYERPVSNMILFDKKFFKCSRVIRDDSLYFKVSYVGKNKDAKLYSYSLEFYMEDKAMSFTEICYPYENADNFNNSLKIPLDSLANFIKVDFVYCDVYVLKND